MQIDELRDNFKKFFYDNVDNWDNGVIPYDLAVDKFGEAQLDELMDLGFIYEPVFGWLKLV